MSILLADILGLAAGLLVDYLADVLPSRHKWGLPFCTYCGAPRPWAAYFRLGACQTCGKPRPWRSAAVLASGLIVSSWLWLFAPLKLGYWWSLALVTFLGLVIIIDIEHRLIQHIVSLFGAVLGLAVGIVAHGIGQTLVGGLVGFVMMLIFYGFGVLYARYQARKQGLESVDEEALGFGDVTLAGVLGLILGFANIFYGLMTGILLAGCFSVFLIGGLLISKKFQPGNVYIPYGPFLILGASVYIFFR